MFESLSVPRRPNWKLRMVVAALVLALGWGIVWFLKMTQIPLTSYDDALVGFRIQFHALSTMSARFRLAVHPRTS